MNNTSITDKIIGVISPLVVYNGELMAVYVLLFVPGPCFSLKLVVITISSYFFAILF